MIGKPMLPKEHGAWMALIVPLAAGSLAAPAPGGVSWAGFALLTVATLAGFLAFTPFRMLIRPSPGMNKVRVAGWLAVYAAVAAGCFFGVAVGLGRTGLLWFIIPAAALSVSYLRSSAARTQRSLPVEMAGIAGLAVSGPAATYVQFGAFTVEALILYLFFLIWFTDRMVTARRALEMIRGAKVFASAERRARFFTGAIAVHAAALAAAALVIALSGGAAPWTAMAPFLLATGRNVADIAMNKPVTDPMKVGFAEMRIGFAFCALMIAAWRI